jgi:hypothetical protein
MRTSQVAISAHHANEKEADGSERMKEGEGEGEGDAEWEDVGILQEGKEGEVVEDGLGLNTDDVAVEKAAVAVEVQPASVSGDGDVAADPAGEYDAGEEAKETARDANADLLMRWTEEMIKRVHALADEKMKQVDEKMKQADEKMKQVDEKMKQADEKMRQVDEKM